MTAPLFLRRCAVRFYKYRIPHKMTVYKMEETGKPQFLEKLRLFLVGMKLFTHFGKDQKTSLPREGLHIRAPKHLVQRIAREHQESEIYQSKDTL